MRKSWHYPEWAVFITDIYGRKRRRTHTGGDLVQRIDFEDPQAE